MDKPTLTIDQLKNYLSTGLILEIEDSAAEICMLQGVGHDPQLGTKGQDLVYFGTRIGMDLRTIEGVKPICYRLSDIHKFYPKRGIRPLGDQMGLNEKFLTENILAFESGNIRYHYYQLLWKYHFWTGPQEYFEMGLVLDKMTYGKEAPNG